MRSIKLIKHTENYLDFDEIEILSKDVRETIQRKIIVNGEETIQTVYHYEYLTIADGEIILIHHSDFGMFENYCEDT